MKRPINYILIIIILSISCSKPIRVFYTDDDTQQITLKLYFDSTFTEKVKKINESYSYSGIWSGNLSENSRFKTIAKKKEGQFITSTPIKEYKIIKGKAILIAKRTENKKYVTVDKSNLREAFILNSSSTFKGYYYKGSDKEFHYFESKWKIEKNKYFKLHYTDLKVTDPFDFGQKEVRICLIRQKNNIKFGENEYYKLYVIN